MIIFIEWVYWELKRISFEYILVIVEWQTRKQQKFLEEFPRGQRGQTVNLLRFVSMVRIRPPPPFKLNFNNMLAWLNGRAADL